MDKPINDAWEEGMMADPADVNPYTPGTDMHAAWRTGSLMAMEEAVERESPAFQVEELLQEVGREIKLEELGYAGIASRIQMNLVTLGRWLTMPVCMPHWIDETRSRLLELTAAAAAVKHPQEASAPAKEGQ